MKKPVYVMLFLLLLFSCNRNPDELEKTELFHLGLGKMEDELDFIFHDGYSFPEDTFLFMRNGLFYISNSPLNKVVEFTSYGDILTAIYNPNQNPQPVSLFIQDEESQAVNRKAFPYNFNAISRLAVDSQKTVFIVDEVDPSLSVFDEQRNLNRKFVIRRFDKNGKYLDAIGYEGVGGTPFPNIVSLQILDNDDIVVVLVPGDSMEVLYYNKSGDLMYSSLFTYDNLPVPVENNLAADLDTIMADPSGEFVYIKIDYFRKSGDENRHSLYSSMIYTYDPVKKSYINSIEIPRIILQPEYSGSVEQKETSLVYSLLGVARGPYFFLYSEAVGQKVLLIILDNEGILVKKIYLELGARDIIFKRFHMTSDGIISGLLLHEYDVEICWWKSDSFIRAIRNEKNR